MLTRPLLSYQDEPVDLFLGRRRMLLAMDPGTGKTVVAIAIAEELLGRGKVSRCLCVVPASLKYQWGQRIAEFTDLPAGQVRAGKELITVPHPPGCVIVDGDQRQRDRQYGMISGATEYVVIGYPNVLSDWDIIRRASWDLAVLDEITAIKNPGSDIARAVRETFTVPYRLGLTGTPVENRPEELYAIMDWVEPGYLGEPAVFDRAYVKRNSGGDVVRYKNLPVLHAQLRPVMYRCRRSDPDVAPYFPAEDEDTWLVTLPGPLRAVYRALAGELLGELRSLRRRGRFDITAAYRGGRPDEGTAVGRVAARMQAMEMLTCHPSLVSRSAAEYDAWQAGPRRGPQPGSRWCSEIIRSGIITPRAMDAVPKLDCLTAQAAAILAVPGTRLLVYTKYTRMLPLLAAAAARHGWDAETYSGDMSAQRKAGAIARYTADPDCRLFLSSHAGAYGVDMHMASHLVNLDVPWSGGKAEQINGRHVRASNSNKVIYLRHLIAEGTLDERKLAQVRFKNRIASAIIDGKGADHLGRIENNIGTLAEFLEGIANV